MDYQKVIYAIQEMNEDEDTEKLERAMNYYCGMWDMRKGFQHALELTLRDQYENHAEDVEKKDLDEIIKILELKKKHHGKLLRNNS